VRLLTLCSRIFTRPHLRLIALVGLIVPRRLRADWRQEWEAELRYRELLLAEWDKLDWRHKLELVRRSIGAFWDALLLQPRRLEDEMFQDLHYGLRMMLKNRGFTLIAVFTLALGIGANTAIFSVVNAVLLRPLPLDKPDELVLVWENSLAKGWKQFSVAPPNFADWREQNHVFEQLAAFRSSSFNLTGDDQPTVLAGARVSSNLFNLLRVQTLAGRVFTAEDDQLGKNHVAVISEGLWQRRFGGRHDVLGKGLSLDGEIYMVVGVLPAKVTFPSRPDVWIPIAFSSEELSNQRRGAHGIGVIGRMKPGVTLERAQEEMSAIAVRLGTQYPASNKGWGITLVSMMDSVVGSGVRRALWVLLGAVVLVLLIACVNVANLLLARSAARGREVAIRSALGASRLRLIRQLLMESAMLSLVGGALGLLIAVSSVGLVRTMGPALNLPRYRDVQVNPTMLAFTLGVSLLAGILFGLAPAYQTTRIDVNDALKEGGQSGGAKRQRLRGLLVVSEVALSLVLLVGAGLLIQSFVRLQRVDPGFDSHNVLTLQVSLPQAKYRDAAQQTNFFRELLGRLRSLPGVEAAAGSNFVPISSSDEEFHFTVEGRPSLAPGQAPSATYYCVTPDYFRVLQIPVRKGRPIGEQDRDGRPRVIVINETMARRFFPNEDPIGQRLRLGRDSRIVREIVGVVADVKHYGLDDAEFSQVYEPFFQMPEPRLTLALRTRVPPATLAAAVRAEVNAIDKDQPVAFVRTLEEAVALSTAQPKFRTVLQGMFAGLSLLLATIGIYGVTAYAVTQRTREIGMRMALGAQPGDVLWLMLRRGMLLALSGVVLGLAGAFALSRVLKALLFEVEVHDPLTFVSMAVLLYAVALAACWIPARRATRVDPLAALKHE